MIKIGLRSGGCLRIDDKGAVDATELQLSDMVWGISGCQRFSNQLDRLYSSGEHSIHLSHLVADKTDFESRIAALFHEAGEGLGIGDIHYQLKTSSQRKLEQKIYKAVIDKFGVSEWTDHELDQQLGNHECLTFHPAKGCYSEIERPQFRVPYGHWDQKTTAAKWNEIFASYTAGKNFLKTEWSLPNNLRPGLPFSIHQVAQQLRGVPLEAVSKKLTDLGCRETRPGDWVR